MSLSSAQNLEAVAIVLAAGARMKGPIHEAAEKIFEGTGE
jgi:hypothetical protein